MYLILEAINYYYYYQVVDAPDEKKVNTGIYYTTNHAYKALKLHNDELGETHRLLGQPVWGKAHERAWAA